MFPFNPPNQPPSPVDSHYERQAVKCEHAPYVMKASIMLQDAMGRPRHQNPELLRRQAIGYPQRGQQRQAQDDTLIPPAHVHLQSQLMAAPFPPAPLAVQALFALQPQRTSPAATQPYGVVHARLPASPQHRSLQGRVISAPPASTTSFSQPASFSDRAPDMALPTITVTSPRSASVLPVGFPRRAPAPPSIITNAPMAPPSSRRYDSASSLASAPLSSTDSTAPLLTPSSEPRTWPTCLRPRTTISALPPTTTTSAPVTSTFASSSSAPVELTRLHKRQSSDGLPEGVPPPIPSRSPLRIAPPIPERNPLRIAASVPWPPSPPPPLEHAPEFLSADNDRRRAGEEEEEGCCGCCCQ